MRTVCWFDKAAKGSMHSCKTVVSGSGVWVGGSKLPAMGLVAAVPALDISGESGMMAPLLHSLVGYQHWWRQCDKYTLVAGG